MAFYSDEEEDGQTTGGDAGGSYIDGAGGAVAKGAAPAKPDNPGHFVGIQDYVKQNSGQATKLANNVSNIVKGRGQEAQGQLSQASDRFGQDATKNTATLNSGLLDQVKTNPTGITGDSGQLSEFEKMRDAKYSGPASLSGADYFKPVSNAITNAKQSAANTGTIEGRNALLTELQNKNKRTASSGAATLDSAILGSSDQGKQMLGRARDQVGGIDQAVSGAEGVSLGQAKGAVDQNAAIAKQVRDALTGSYGDLGKSLTDREAVADKAQQNEFAGVQNAANTGSLTAAQMKQLGLVPGQKTYGVNSGDYLKYADGADKYSVATSEDLARQQALKQLSGDTSLGDDYLNSASPIGQTASPINFDKTGYGTAVQKQEAAYTSDLARPLASYVKNLPPELAGATAPLPDLIAQYQDAVTKQLQMGNQKDAAKNQLLLNKLKSIKQATDSKYGMGAGAAHGDRQMIPVKV